MDDLGPDGDGRDVPGWAAKLTDSSTGDALIQLAGQSLVLLPERAVFWREQAALLVADLHWGKASSFRAQGIAVPEPLAADLARLSQALKRTAARRLIILGDLLHARLPEHAPVEPILAWRRSLGDVECWLIRGNHDHQSGDPPEEWRIRCVQEPWPWGPFALRHTPPADCASDGYALAGHLHPAVVLGRGHQRLRIPCFCFGPRQGLLPAFGSFTGTSVIRPRRGDRVFGIAEASVVPIPIG